MSFNVSPKDAPASNNDQPQQKPQSPRDRAIAAFKASQNSIPSAVTSGANTPPEVAMAQAAANISESVVEDQKDTIEETSNVDNESKPAVTEKTLSPQYAALARKEKALRAQAQQFKAEQFAFKAEQEAAKSRQAELERKVEALERLEKDPWSVLNERGISYDQITAGALDQPTPEEQRIRKLEARITAQDEERQRDRKAFEESQTTQYKQAVEQIRFETKALVNNDPAFESIKATGSFNDVVDLIEQTFKEDGVLLTVEDAANEVEKELSERLYKYASTVSKVRQRLTNASGSGQSTGQKQQSTAPTKAASNNKQVPSQQMKTLTNAVGSTRQLNARERAILAFKGELK